MAPIKKSLLEEIEVFLAEALRANRKMSESYFGKCAAGNSELVPRLRSGGRVWPETEAKVRSFIKRNRVLSRGRGDDVSERQLSKSARARKNSALQSQQSVSGGAE